MKFFFHILTVFILLFTIIQCKKNAGNTGGQSESGSIALQKEMLEILERNVENPKNALVELDDYYSRHAQVLKTQLQAARQNMENMRNQYQNQNTLPPEEKALSERQMLAIQKQRSSSQREHLRNDTKFHCHRAKALSKRNKQKSCN